MKRRWEEAGGGSGSWKEEVAVGTISKGCEVAKEGGKGIEFAESGVGPTSTQLQVLPASHSCLWGIFWGCE